MRIGIFSDIVTNFDFSWFLKVEKKFSEEVAEVDSLNLKKTDLKTRKEV